MENSLTKANEDSVIVKRNYTDDFFRSYFDGIEELFNSFFTTRTIENNNNMFTELEKTEYFDSWNKFMENKTSLTYTLPVAGCSKEDVSVELEGNVVTIKASYESDAYSKTYKDSFVLNLDMYDEDSIEATVENGLLTLTFQKKETDEPAPEKKKLL